MTPRNQDEAGRSPLGTSATPAGEVGGLSSTPTMTNRERMRLHMAHIRQQRRAKGLCPRCGLVKVLPGKNCGECNGIVAAKRRGGFPVAEMPSTRAS